MPIFAVHIHGFDFLNPFFIVGQMETWRKEFQRVEEQGDEEGFEEL